MFSASVCIYKAALGHAAQYEKGEDWFFSWCKSALTSTELLRGTSVEALAHSHQRYAAIAQSV